MILKMYTLFVACSTCGPLFFLSQWKILTHPYQIDQFMMMDTYSECTHIQILISRFIIEIISRLSDCQNNQYWQPKYQLIFTPLYIIFITPRSSGSLEKVWFCNQNNLEKHILSGVDKTGVSFGYKILSTYLFR